MTRTIPARPAAAAALLATVVLTLAAPDRPADARPAPADRDTSPRGLASPPAVITAAAPRFVERPGEMEFTGRLIVTPKTAAARQTADPAIRFDAAELERRDRIARSRLAPHQLEHFPGPDRYIIEIPAGHDENSFASELLATDDYAFVHPDWMCYPLATPNDPQFSQQWHHQMMESEAGWDITVGSPDLVLAFVDTGVDLSHPDLAPVLVPGFNSVSDLPQAEGGDMTDINGHGTLVGGSIGAVGDNGIGVASVGWNFSLMPIRTSEAPGGGASLGNILQGAEWAIENGARTASCSYSGVQSQAIQASGAYIRSLGGMLLYAAGNSNQDHAGFDWADAVVVGATDQAYNKAGFSSYGLGVYLFAPGVGILTTSNGGGYAAVNGTSFSTPIANGVAGLIWAVDPSLSVEQVEQILFMSCDDKGEPGNDDFWGWGRANIRRAVEVAASAGTPQQPLVADDAAETLGGETIVIAALANDFDLNLDPMEIVAIDAVTPLGGTAEVLDGAGPDGRDLVQYTAPTGGIGLDSFSYTVSDGSFEVSGTITVDLLDPSLFRAPDEPAATEPGSDVAYYALEPLNQLPDFATLEPYAFDVVSAVDFASTGGDFATSGRADDIGAVFTGFIEVPVPAQYILSVESDDGSKMWVGDQLVVNNDGLHDIVEVSGVIALQAGRHAVRVEFFERGGGAGCIVRIEGGPLARQIVPASRWSREVEAPCTGDIDGNGFVAFNDVLELLAAWGACPPGDCAADLDGSGAVDFSDLLTVLAVYGPCP